MCGRYVLKSPPVDLSSLFGVDIRDNFPPRYNICPSQPVAVIRQSEMRCREYALMRWGFIPSWAKGEYLSNLASRPMINARAETVLEKPSFSSAVKRRRCLVPADGFYEWRKEKGAKQPYCIQRDGLFAFAGIWETACDPDGGEIDTMAILTTASGADLRGLHAREPIVIGPKDFVSWLEADERDVALYSALMKSALPGSWSIHAVSKAVNSPRHDGPELIEPLAA